MVDFYAFGGYISYLRRERTKITCMRIFTILSFAALITSASSPLFGQCVTATTISTVAGNHTTGYTGDGGAANSAQMNSPYAVTTDAAGNLYIADYFNHAVRKMSTTGVMTTVAGTGTPGFSGDGGSAAAAELNGPAGVTVDNAGNLYISDKFNERIRKVNLGTGIITTIAGNGLHGGWQGAQFGNNGPATAAALTYPVATAIDCSGNIYIADNGSQTVRKINAAGIISHFAGTHASGYNGDGIPATAAELNSPQSIAVDCSGNVYISDTWNNRIRKVNVTGIISTVAGNGTSAYSGDGGNATAASLYGPWGIKLDACGNLYICDYDNYVVRKVTASGTITTIAGNNLMGYTGDGEEATTASVYLPSDIAIDADNNLFIADFGNYVIRLMGSVGFSARAFNGGTTQYLHACEGTTASLDELMSITDAVAGNTETWVVSADPMHGKLGGLNATIVSQGGVVKPAGLSYTPEAGYTGTDEFTVMMSDGTTTASTTITVITDPLATPGILSTTTAGDNAIQVASTGGDAGGIWTSSDEMIAVVDPTGKVTATGNGIATISYSVTNSCGARSATTTVQAVARTIAAGTVVAYPNPSTGSLRMDFAAETDNETTLIVTDIVGKVVYTEKIQAITGMNSSKITLPSSIAAPSILRISLIGGTGMKYKTTTISVMR
jgi:sugar lactone lactonase YvrE